MRSTWLLLLTFAFATHLPAAEPKPSGGRSIELFRDDFSRFPPGMLSRPIGFINGAIQEYQPRPSRCPHPPLEHNPLLSRHLCPPLARRPYPSPSHPPPTKRTRKSHTLSAPL